MMLLELRKRVLAIAQKASQLQLVPGTAGNFSARDPETGLVAITPNSYPYDVMTPKDIVVVDLQGEIVDGVRPPSSETPMHTLILREHPEYLAVVHTHSPYATCFAVLNRGIPLILTEVAGRLGGTVPVVPFEIPGTDELGKAVLEYIGPVPAVLLQNHGVVVVGKSPEDALKTAILVEDEAKVYYLTLNVGTPLPLNADKIERIKKHGVVKKKELAAALKRKLQG